jgi:hypothetical protein
MSSTKKGNEKNRCEHRGGCDNPAVCGLPGSDVKTHCRKHGEPLGLRFIYATRSGRCAVPECDKFASYGGEDGKKTHCREHGAPLGLRGLTNKKCATPGCDTAVNGNKHGGYCLRCRVYLFPDRPGVTGFKAKEQYVIDYLRALCEMEGIAIPIVHDKRDQGGCSNRRPDALVDCLTHNVIVEVDENGHNTEAYCSCEDKRMMEVFVDLGSRPTVVLRINPDAYADAKGVKHRGCFGYNERLGVPNVKDEGAWEERMRVLGEQFVACIRNIPDKELDVRHLYFDGFHAPDTAKRVRAALAGHVVAFNRSMLAGRHAARAAAAAGAQGWDAPKQVERQLEEYEQRILRVKRLCSAYMDDDTKPSAKRLAKKIMATLE